MDAPAHDLRLRTTIPDLVGLPWHIPLGEWTPLMAPLRDIPVGPSRHVVRFVRVDSGLFALKELPPRIARREYGLLRRLEGLALPSVRAVGLVEPGASEAVLVTAYLEHGFQLRRTLARLAAETERHRERLLDALSWLLVELHTAGLFWGDCSLANTLFRRDGQRLQAVLVDAETAELHPSLSDGQRRHDLDVMVENIAGELFDIGRQAGSEVSAEDAIAQAEGIAARYDDLWAEVVEETPIAAGDRRAVDTRIRRLNELGFAVDEIEIVPPSPTGAAGSGRGLRLRVAVAGRRFHATRLHGLTGLEAGEGQAAVLLADLRAFAIARGLAERAGASAWLAEAYLPGARAAAAAVGEPVTPVQAYCDLLEVRWLLSEEAGADVGDAAALAALAARRAPTGSSASLVEVEAPAAPEA